MSDTLRKVKTGDPLKIPAATFNTFIDRHMSEDMDKRREYSEVEQIETHRLATFLLTSKAQAPPAQLMAEDVEEDNS